MKGQIAVNTKRSGDPRKNHRGYAEPFTSEQVDGLLSEAWLRQMVADIRTGQEEKKDQLPFICPHYRRFNNNHRAQADIIPEAFTFMTCVDVDNKALVEKAIKRSLELNSEAGGDWEDMVLRIDYSARKKVHIWIMLPVGKSISEAQMMFCQEIDVPYDESCVTPERFIYLTGIDEEVYRSERWLEVLSDDEIEERREAYLNRGLDVDGRPLKKGEGHTQKFQSPCAAEQSQCVVAEADERTRFIFRECMKEENLDDNDLIKEGGRHNSVKMILGQCNQLLTKEETLGVLKELMPDNWQDDNIQQLVKAYYTDYYNPNQRLSLFQKRVFKEGKKILEGKAGNNTQVTGTSVPPQMPKKLPKLIELLVSKTPAMYKPAVAHAIFPPLATHLCGVSFNYTDNKEHEATLMNCLMAGTGEGKGCIDDPIKHIMADIKMRDEINERRETEWKKDCQKKGANKDKMVRPEGLVIQIIDPDMTKPALVTRMDESENHFVYVKLNELDLFEQLKGQTGKQHFQLMCLAFDPGAEYGQTRVGTQSVTARPKCRFNWNACTTIQKGRKFFSKVLTDGPISRINFCTIPEQEIGGEQPVYGKYDAAFDEQLKTYIDNLCNARGRIDCPQATRLAKKLQEECAEFARLSQDKVYWNLSHRACVIAWLKACVLYVANGQKWEKAIEEFIFWSLRFDMYCKMAFFGEDIGKASSEGDKIGSRGPQNLLVLLPDEFTIEDANRVRQQQGLKNEGQLCIKMIRTWINRKYVIQNTEYSFVKADRFKNKK